MRDRERPTPKKLQTADAQPLNTAKAHQEQRIATDAAVVL